MEPNVAAHVLLVQQPQEGFKSALLSVFDSAFVGQQVTRSASMVPTILRYSTLIGLAYRDIDCQDRTNTCDAWVGDAALPPDTHAEAIDGHSLIVALHTHQGNNPNIPDEWFLHSPHVAPLPHKGNQHIDEATPHNPPMADVTAAPAVRVTTGARTPVQISLDACLIRSPLPPPFSEHHSALLWFLHADWKSIVGDSLNNQIFPGTHTERHFDEYGPTF